VSSEPAVLPLLPFVATQQLTDHHCHGVLRSGGDLDELLNEADGDAARDGLAFDTLAGMAFGAGARRCSACGRTHQSPTTGRNVRQ